MTTLSGCTLVRNAVKLKYPLEASIRTYYPICDEVVIAFDPTTPDGTADFVRDLGRRYPKIRLIPNAWDMDNHTGGTEITLQSNVGIRACRGDWTLYVQADEAIHEGDHDAIRRAMEDPGLMGGVFHRRSFLVSLDREIPEHCARGLLRLFKRGTCLATGDAMSCAPISGGRGKILTGGWRMFNYSRVGKREDILDRCRHRDAFHISSPEEIDANVERERLEGGAPFDRRGHPTAIQEWFPATSARGEEQRRPEARVSLVFLLGNGERFYSAPMLWQFRGWTGNVVILDDETTDGGAEVMMANLENILGIGLERVKLVRRSIGGNFGEARNLLHELAESDWVLHVAPDELWDPALVAGIEPLVSQLERDGKSICALARANYLDGVLSNDLPNSEGTEDGLNRRRRYQGWPPRNSDIQYRLMRRQVRWTGKVHEQPVGIAGPEAGREVAILRDHWILHNKTLQRQKSQDRLYDRILGKGSSGGKTAVLVMLAPGCEGALERLFASLFPYRSSADLYVSLDGLAPSLPDWVHVLRPPEGMRGIVRPTKWAIRELTRRGRYGWILRLAWDAELVMPLDFPREPRTVYGSLRFNPDGRVKKHLLELGIPADRAQRLYADGYAILAPLAWWNEAYLTMPDSISHYGDDAISCAIGETKGFQVAHLPLANHRHYEWRTPKKEGVHV